MAGVKNSGFLSFTNMGCDMRTACLTAILASLVAGSAAGNTIQYTVTDLGNLAGDSESAAYGINNSGQVVGASYIPMAWDSTGHAFLYSNGTMSDLGTIGGFPFSAASGINASGQVVGYAGAAPGFTFLGDNHAFIYSNGTMTELHALGAYAATGINDSGQVVGTFIPSGTGSSHAFLYSNGTMTDLGTLGGKSSYAYGVNAGGQVVGDANTADNAAYHAFLYTNGNMQNLGDLGGGVSVAYGINASGQVVGYAGTAGDVAHAFLYSNGTMTDLGTLAGYADSCALGINAGGQVVGEDDNISGDTYRLFSLATEPCAYLNSLIDTSSGWTLEEATAVNDNGWIVGQGYNSLTGQEDAVLLTPIPEPSTFVLLCAAAGLLAFARRHRLLDISPQNGYIEHAWCTPQ